MQIALAIMMTAMLTQPATIEVAVFPTELVAASSFETLVQFQLNELCTQNRRVCVTSQVCAFPSGEVLMEWYDDNAGRGYRKPLERIMLEWQLPEAATPVNDLYFRAFLSPYGFNEHLLAQIEKYPTDGTHQYWWSGENYGVTHDLQFRDELVLPGSATGTTYCCGTTFQAFVEAAESYRQLPGAKNWPELNATLLQQGRLWWYGVYGSWERQGIAWVARQGLGIELEDPRQARAGDLLQFWRHSGSGHATIFIEWIEDGGQVCGVKYWSSQPATKGIGYHIEKFGRPKGLDWNRTTVGRIRKPRDGRDWIERHADHDTSAQPTRVRW